MSRRGEQLKNVVSDFLAVHDEWADDDNRPNPDDVYWDAVTDLLEAYDDEVTIPGELRAVDRAVGKFRDEVETFETEDDQNNLYPKDPFWAAIEGIRKAMAGGEQRKQLPPLEPIKQLCGMPYMTHAQVAEMWGLRDRNGKLMPSLVQKELDTPGSVIATPGGMDGRDWVDPRLKDLEQDEANDDDRTERVARKGRNAAKESAACKETAEQLWEQEVPPKQAAAMLKRPEAEVAKQFNDWTAARDFQLKVWKMMDEAVPVEQIAKKLKAKVPAVEDAIRARPAVGATEGDE